MSMPFISSVEEQTCVNLLMAYVRSSMISFPWRSTMHSTFSVDDSMSDEELDQLAPWNEDVKAELKRRAESSDE